MYRRKVGGWMKHFDFILLDLLFLQVAYLLAQWIRNGKLYPRWNPMYVSVNVVILLAAFFGAILTENHKNILKRSWTAELVQTVKLVVLVVVVVLVYLFIMKDPGYFSRMVLFWFGILSAGLLLLFRSLWKLFLSGRNTIGSAKPRMLLVTTEALAEQAIETMRQNAFGAFELTGVVLAHGTLLPGQRICDLTVVATTEDLIRYIRENWVDEIMIYLDQNTDSPKEIMDLCLEMGVTTHLRLGIDTERNCMQQIEKVAGTMVLTESIRITSTRALFAKRVMDIAGALVGLVITGILTVIIGIAIQISDPGPVFFSQERVGKGGRVFRLYKFRTMYKDAERRKSELMEQNMMKGLMFKVENDPRIIGSGPDGKRHGLGWFLRKTSIDEFPQFLNVLKGDMSLVGTRPPTLDEWQKYELHHRLRMAIKPGLTGLWQVSGRSDVTDFEEVIAFDREYINTWSIAGDWKIIFKTIKAVFTGRGAK